MSAVNITLPPASRSRKRKYRPAIIRGRDQLPIAVTEPDAGSDFVADEERAP